MKKNIGTIILVILIFGSALMGFTQYQKERRGEEKEVQSETSWDTPWGKATIKKVGNIDETENEKYDTSKNYYSNYDDTGLLTCRLTGIFANSEEEAIKQVRDSGKCKYAYLTEDGICIIKLTDEQRKLWIGTAENTLNQISEKNSTDYSFEVSSDYKKLNIVASEDGDAVEFHSNTMRILFAIEILQMFNGADDWNVNVIVTNVKNNNEIINVDYPKEDFTIKPEMWNE